MSLCIIAPCKDSSPGPARDALANFMADYTALRGRPSLVSCWLSSNVADVRTRLAERAIADAADQYLWLDDDIVFTTYDALALLDASEDVVSGCYPQKRIGAPIVGGATPNGEHRGPLVELDVAGFGLLAMRRHVLEAAVSARPFECRQEGRSVGEDEAFSRWWRARGGRLWLHTDVMLGHVGPHIFRWES